MNRRRDVLPRLVRDDPEAHVRPGEVDERGERILETILATPLEASRGPRAKRRRLAASAAIALATVVLLGGAGIAAARLSLFDFRPFPRPADVADEPRRTGAKEVVTAGVEPGVAWRLVAYRSTRGLCYGVEAAGAVRAAAAACGVPDVRSRLSLPTADYIGGAVDRTWLYGRVSTRATRVTLTLADGRRVDASVVPAPRSLQAPFAFYIATLDGAIARSERDTPSVVRVRAYDVGGRTNGTARPPSRPHGGN